MSAPWILVVEDQPALAKDIENELHRLGYETLPSISSGEEAARVARQVKPDVILLKAALPGAPDGAETARLIRQRTDIPIIFLTTSTQDEIAKRAALTEPFDCLVRPFRPRELCAAVETALFKACSERTLKNSHHQFALLFQHMPAGFALLEVVPNPDGRPCDSRFLEVNSAFERLMERKRSDLVGRTVLEVRPDTNPVWIERGNRVALTGEPDFFELSAPEVGRWYEVRTFSPAYGRFAVLFQNITERYLAEAALRESEELYRLLFLASPEAIILSTRAEGRVLEVNGTFTVLSGHSHDEVIGRTAIELGFYRDAAERETLLQAMEKDGGIRKWESCVRRTTGEVIPALVSMVPVAIGELDCVLSLWLDISKRKKAESQLVRLQTAVEHMAESLVITDVQGRIEYVNPAFTTLTGYAREEVLGENPRILKSGEHPPAFYANLWATLTQGRTWHGLFLNLRKDGIQFEEESVISPIYGEDGEISGYLAVKRDVTAERSLQKRVQERDRLAAIGELAGAIAHEVKNPLFAITGGLQVLDMELPLSEDQRAYLRTIMAEGMRIDRLIRQLRTYSRPVQLDLRPIDLREVVAAAVLAMRGPARQKGVSYALDAAAVTHPILADPDKLTQVFVNLLQNAVEASERGTEIRVALVRVPGGLKVVVEDQGVGIPAKVLSRVFDPLFTTKPGNTGLGLNLSRTIVGQHGGEIVAESRQEGGARFTVFLPLVTDKNG